jgi:general secretion pathway protein I
MRADTEQGFTLIEVLVALAIFSLAALAMLRLQGAAMGTTARLDEKAVAAIVARNQAIAVTLQPQPPSYGSSSGEDENAGRRWRWTQTVTRSPDPRLQQIEIRVAGADGSTAASLFVVRSAA